MSKSLRIALAVLLPAAILAGVLIVLLFLPPAASRTTQAPFLSQLKSQAQWTYAELSYQYYMHQSAVQQSAFLKATKSGRAVLVPYPPGHTEAGMSMERAIESFASSNRIALIHFQTPGSTSAQVYVWPKDASAMRAFVNSLGATTNQHPQPTPQ